MLEFYGEVVQERKTRDRDIKDTYAFGLIDVPRRGDEVFVDDHRFTVRCVQWIADNSRVRLKLE